MAYGRRNNFSLSHYKLLTGDMGKLIPIGLQEVLPGDEFRHFTEGMIRLSPLVKPIMHPLHVRIHHFFVPNRLLWARWDDFIRGADQQELPSTVEERWKVGYSLDFPTVELPNVIKGSLADYLGIPVWDYSNSQGRGKAIRVNALPFRAYAKIWNDFFRNEFLEQPLNYDFNGGNDRHVETLILSNDSWMKDYFTGCTTEDQNFGVIIPLKGQGDVYGNGNDMQVATHYPIGNSNPSGILALDENGKVEFKKTADSGNQWSGDPSDGDIIRLLSKGDSIEPGIFGAPHGRLDLSPGNITAGDINELRTLFSLQKFGEARRRYGTRIVEYLRYAFGVKVNPGRHDKVEYLGGSRDTIQFSEVLQTAPGQGTANEGNTVGALKGHGIGTMRSKRYRRFFPEHGYVMSLMSIRPIPVYHQGLDKHWLKNTMTDYYQKELAHIGQQPVYHTEVFADIHGSQNGEDVDHMKLGSFGFRDVYDDYRSARSRAHAEFGHTGTRQGWHMARTFSTPPVLNSSFLRSAPTDRIFADKTAPEFTAMVMHSIKARRCVSKTGRPGGLV